MTLFVWWRFKSSGKQRCFMGICRRFDVLQWTHLQDDNTASHSKTLESSATSLWRPQCSQFSTHFVITRQIIFNICKQFYYRICFVFLRMKETAMFLSRLSKNDVISAGLTIEKIQNIRKKHTCNTPLYAIPSGITNIKLFYSNLHHMGYDNT